MSGRSTGVLVVLTITVALLGLTGAAMAQQLHTVPFDTALSMYVAHSGTWQRFDILQYENAEIEDAVAAYTSSELLDDGLGAWYDHQINDPQAPTGWGCFDCQPGQFIDLHVVVRDTQNRLGQVVVTDRNTGANLGTLQANAQGSEVNGTIAVDPEAEAFALDVKQKQSGTLLMRAGSNLRAFRDVLVFSLSFGWEPNVGDQHTPCYASRTTSAWGDPLSLVGKTSVPAVVTRNACGGMPFENDNPYTGNYQAKYNPPNRLVLRDFGPPPAGLPIDGGPKVVTAMDAARQPYAGGQAFLPQFTALPFSKGVAHYPMQLTAKITSLLYFPYCGTTEWRDDHKSGLIAQAEEVASAGTGWVQPSFEVAYRWEWGKVTTEVRKQLGNPVAIGDLWGLLASSAATPTAEPLQPFTAPVTFELRGDWVPPPPGAPGLMGGNGSATKTATAWTTPPPPTPYQNSVGLTFPYQGPDMGRCTVQLAKGWWWTATGAAMSYTPGQVGPFDVPVTETKTITATLNTVLSLYLTTGTTTAFVQLERQVGGGWVSMGSGNTSLVNGVQTWARGEGPPGLYRARALRLPEPPPSEWSEWKEFQAVPAVRMTVELDVP